MRAMWREVLSELGLGDSPYVLAGLRAGAATKLFIEGTDIARLKFLGRWKNLNTLEHYVQEGVSAAAMARIPQAAQQKIASVLSQVDLFAQPPAQEWWTFFSRQCQFRGTPSAWQSRRKP